MPTFCIVRNLFHFRPQLAPRIYFTNTENKMKNTIFEIDGESFNFFKFRQDK